MNLRDYRQKNGMSTAEFVERAREVAPKFSKVTFCMCQNREYGVMLRPVVVRHIKGKPDNRRNPYRVQFRVTQAQKERLTELQDVLSVTSMQEVMMFIVKYFMAQYERSGNSNV